MAAMLLAVALAGCAAGPGMLERRLAADDSATRVLERLCRDRMPATPAEIVAERIADAGLPPPAPIRALLRANPDEPIRHRHVRLRCGAETMSVAHNWYLPSRLPKEVNSALEAGTIPFGKAVGAVGFTRQRLSSRRTDPMCPQGTALAQRAVLRLPDGSPLAALIECYPERITRSN